MSTVCLDGCIMITFFQQPIVKHHPGFSVVAVNASAWTKFATSSVIVGIGLMSRYVSVVSIKPLINPFLRLL